MKFFLDAQIDGMVKYLRVYNYEVTSASNEGLSDASDVELVNFAKERGYTFVTMNDDAAKFAKMLECDHILIDMVFLAKALHREYLDNC
jgi:predicted nuclease of predicted toxin-antitoxin system